MKVYRFCFSQDEEEWKDEQLSVPVEKQEIKMLLRQREAEVRYPTTSLSQFVQHSHPNPVTDVITLMCR